MGFIEVLAPINIPPAAFGNSGTTRIMLTGTFDARHKCWDFKATVFEDPIRHGYPTQIGFLKFTTGFDQASAALETAVKWVKDDCKQYKACKEVDSRNLSLPQKAVTASFEVTL